MITYKSHLNTLMYFLVKSLSMLFIYVITTIIRTRILLLLISSGSAPALCLNKAAGGRQRWGYASLTLHILNPSPEVTQNSLVGRMLDYLD